MRRRRRRLDRSLRPVLSMFLLGLFMLLGFSPSSVIFDTVIGSVSQYISYAALIAMVIMIYVVYDNIYRPLDDMFKAYKACGTIGIISMVFAFLAGILIFVNLTGIILLAISAVLWKAANYFR